MTIMILGIIMMFKTIRTYIVHTTIDNAIYFYRIRCIDSDETAFVDFEDTEAFEQTLFRLYDWGYKRILPKEKFEIIKPYIIERR